MLYNKNPDKKTPPQTFTPLSDQKSAFFDQESGAFFRKLDWGAFWTTFLISFGVYCYTLAPTVTLEDSGELAVGSDYLGVPHPPGYPSWTLFTWFFQWIFGWVRYYGNPNPAWSVGLASAFFGALACGTLALLVSRSGADMLRGVKHATEVLGYATENMLCWIGGVTSGLLLAFSPVLWSQSVIVEVYSLNAFFQMILLLLLYRWMCRPKESKTLFAIAFLFGFGLTNHQTLMFLGMALAVGVLVKDIRLFRDFAVVGGILFFMVFINTWAAKHNQPEMMWLRGPSSTAFWVYTVLAVVIPLCGLVLPNGKVVCISFLLVELGLSFYAFMPFASEQNPPINWGYPRTWEGFIHAITRGQYEKITLTDIFSAKFVAQVGSYLSDLRGQFTLPIVLAGFLPFCAWSVSWGKRRFHLLYVALALAALTIPCIVLEDKLGWHSLSTVNGVEIAYKLFSVGILLLAVVGCILLTVGFIKSLFKGQADDAEGSMGVGVRFDTGPHLQRWFLTSFVAFISLGIVLIAFQNPDLDIQTLFIGRVQFIQSHAVYALWLGYGIILAFAYLETWLGGRGIVKFLGAATVAILPFALVWQNAFDKEQIKIVGGAEQNQHDFGWQFGHWQLQGVDGIRSDLSYKKTQSEFESIWKEYPTPTYPPPMETNAIFFGGTDPGRFVPTYMIYCAKVRPDVYLITQNALADNTYMNVMRDLYGDTIWIPSQQDSNYAFQKYVDDVQNGRIPAGADVQLENGRVSVQGVQGVMMINGILCRMIFEANKQKNAFYVEESYVISWMYPYLTPNGLIMKLNSESQPSLSPELVQNDHDFWTWHTKRLLKNTKFTRDVVARKTFSKLRGAIAGIYAYRRMFDEAEFAFRQAIDLYPLSPEANFRLADVYMQQRKFSSAGKLIEQFLREDPDNSKVRDFLNQIRDTEKADNRRIQLEGQFNEGQGELNTAMELADIYRKLGMEGQFQNLSMNILNDTNIPPDAYLAIAKMYADAKRMDLLATALEKYLAREPSNPRVWIDLAAIRLAMQKSNDAMQSLKRAIDLAGESARDILRTDPRFNSIRESPEFKTLVPPMKSQGLPMNLPML